MLEFKLGTDKKKHALSTDKKDTSRYDNVPVGLGRWMPATCFPMECVCMTATKT